jgi:hypothetical protein
MMPPRRFSQRMHLDEAPPQEPTNHPPPNQPIETLPTIDKVSEHPTFGNIPKMQFHKPTHASNSAARPSQTSEVATPSHTIGGTPHQSPLRAPSPIHKLPRDTELGQVQVDDWDEEAEEEEAVAEEEELARVQ